jgi:hypothetical protein
VEVPAAGETVDGFSLALVCATDGISAIIVKNAEKAKY